LSASGLAVRLGATFPQIVHEPPDVASRILADDAIELANAYLFDAPACLSPSQELRLRNGMATRADGTWAASRVGDFGGRQGAGKTDTILARILAGILLLDERLIIYTAHEFPTANEIFLRLGSLFQDWDDLAAELAREPKRAHGDQGFELRGGRRILIKTRTGKSGRGFAKADLLIYDEAQHLLPEHVAGSGPAKLAHPNPQSWYAGSGGLSTSSVAWAMRRQALTGTGGRLSYTEHTAQAARVEGDGRVVLVDPDPTDRNAWAMAMPGLGRWVTEEGMEDMRVELGDLFPREGLCVWEPEPTVESPGVIDLAQWDLCAKAESSAASNRTWALAVSPDQSWASLAIAGRREDGLLHVDVVDRRKGTTWIVDRVVDGFNEYRLPLRVAARDRNTLVSSLRERGVNVVELPLPEVAQGVGLVRSLVDAGRIAHLGRSWLRAAVKVAQLSSSGLWVGPDGVDVSSLDAVTLAASGVPAQAKQHLAVFVT